jgi:hypothetical protein
MSTTPLPPLCKAQYDERMRNPTSVFARRFEHQKLSYLPYFFLTNYPNIFLQPSKNILDLIVLRGLNLLGKKFLKTMKYKNIF